MPCRVTFGDALNPTFAGAPTLTSGLVSTGMLAVPLTVAGSMMVGRGLAMLGGWPSCWAVLAWIWSVLIADWRLAMRVWALCTAADPVSAFWAWTRAACAPWSRAEMAEEATLRAAGSRLRRGWPLVTGDPGSTL